MFLNFTNLEELSLAFAQISSVLPTSLNISSSLKLLNLAETGLQGKLPHYIFNLPSLKTLDLGNNYFTGNIPSEISLLPKLVNLSIGFSDDNMFSGNVRFDSFSLPSLEELNLSFNNFSGEWELDTFFSSFRNLEYLELSYSGFSITIINGNHYINPGFEYLGLTSCKLKGFPYLVRAMKQLKILDLSSNEIHGIRHWAKEIGALPQLQWHGLRGPFPPSICNMNQLRFQGTIPSLYFDCEWLTGLSLKGNQLEGEVPSSLSKCIYLSVLDLGNNHLNGTFPGWLGDLPNLI
ncbi:Leucine-rich repeat-containing protein [Artemisia annua]|uniref:Leucine-rich repeat-containing protein n=1 Tax=Artemisia annua TaxID=35608 RepID=A0A2U1QDL1_ARTAN|nr:Leucine-rich repeat-containing protein [Artemisia annua]